MTLEITPDGLKQSGLSREYLEQRLQDMRDRLLRHRLTQQDCDEKGWMDWWVAEEQIAILEITILEKYLDNESAT